MNLEDKVRKIMGKAVIFLSGEKPLESPIRPLYTKEELKELYSIKKSIEKYPEKSEE